MATNKYDLHTAEYSVSGWDAILSADMEALDEIINSRVIGQLGETVAAYQALYLAADGKWYKAQADGTKQPAQGLAVESGDADDEIRIYRLGEAENEDWTWTIGPVYLDADTAGALTQTRPARYPQLIGYAVSATVLYLFPLSLELTVAGSSGGLVRRAVEKAVAITASATVACGLAIPSGARLLGAQFRVDAALAETWDADYSGGSSTALVAAGEVAKNTKKNVLHDAEIASGATDIVFSPNAGGSFTAQGQITVIAYYEELVALEDAA